MGFSVMNWFAHRAGRILTELDIRLFGEREGATGGAHRHEAVCSRSIPGNPRRLPAFGYLKMKLSG